MAAPGSLPSLLLLLLSLSGSSRAFTAAEYRLDDAILAKYRPYLRPVTDPSDRIIVNISILRLAVTSFDEETSTAALTLFVRKEWSDQLLRWSPARYSGLTELHVPAAKIWRPDIVLLTGADPTYAPVHPPLVRIRHTGRVRWSLHVKPTVHCRHDYSRFPKDDVRCSAVFEAWSYDNKSLGFRLTGWGLVGESMK